MKEILKGFKEEYINKEINSKFYSKNLSLCSSLELFSSYSVDEGSSLLLQTIGKEFEFEKINSVLDIGCGIGTLGLTLKTQNPQMKVDFTDRDALALEFTEYNNNLNKFSSSTYSGSLGINQIYNNNNKYDLVICNIPAKAGNPVIEQMIQDFSRMTKPSDENTKNGIVAIVIVKTLSDFAREVIQKYEGEIIFEKVTHEYTVFHYRNIKTANDFSNNVKEQLTPYIRGTYSFNTKKIDYTLDCVYGIPEFDNISFGTEITINILEKTKVTGKTLFINPGQGHIPVLIQSKNKKSEIDELHLASRDLLSLIISEYNCVNSPAYKNDLQITKHHIPYLSRLDGEYDFIFINYEKENFKTAHKLLVKELKRLLSKEGLLLITGKSTPLFRIDTEIGIVRGLIRINDIKYNGYRTILYKVNNLAK